MKCRHCLKEIDEESTFCEFCGKGQNLGDESDVYKNEEVNKSDLIYENVPVHDIHTTLGSPRPSDEDLSGTTIVKGADGVYRWVYQMNMWTNPTLVITLLKVVLVAALVPTFLVSGLELFERGVSEAISAFIEVGSIVGMVMLVLFAIAYPLVAVMNGGRYCVAFELDEKGVKHIQMQKQFKHSQVLSMITALAGAVAGNPTVMGAGLLASSKKSSYSQFSKVKSVVARANRHVMYVNESFERNQVYVSGEDFQWVLEFIGAHCKKAKVTRR